MLIRCAWCKRILGSKPPYGGKHDKEITDGICDECSREYFPSNEQEEEGVNERGYSCN